MKKLIPHVFMSKDDFPRTINTDIILNKLFEFMENWKSKLYDMLSFNTFSANQVIKGLKISMPEKSYIQMTGPAIKIKQEPMDEVRSIKNHQIY